MPLTIIHVLYKIDTSQLSLQHYFQQLWLRYPSFPGFCWSFSIIAQWQMKDNMTNSQLPSCKHQYHIDILSNGRYLLVVHRAVVNSNKSHISMATLMTISFKAKIVRTAKLIDEHHLALFWETKFVDFMNLLASKECKAEEFRHFFYISTQGMPRWLTYPIIEHPSFTFEFHV